MPINTLAAAHPAESERAIPDLSRQDLSSEGIETDHLREEFAQQYQDFFSDPQNTKEEADRVMAILEMAANDLKLCRLIEAIDEKEISIKEARIQCS